MKYLRELVKENGHFLVRYNQCKVGHNYMMVFDYSIMYGGTYDAHKFYNDYVVDLGYKC